jgi:CheY-like chemotaxis protein
MATEPILIVLAEDDDGHASLVQRNLERAGLTNSLQRLNDGQEALDFLRGEGAYASRNSNQPVLLLLDIKMPRVDGMEVLRQLKSDPRTALIPVIMLTTTDDPREIQRCYELGCSVYITKPVEYQGFVEAIKRFGLFLQVNARPRERPEDILRNRHGVANPATILLVEDDPSCPTEQLRLERAGYTVTTAATAEAGLRKVADGEVALIVLDQQLTSGVSGLEFFRQVKAAGYNVPAILVTGMQEENLLVEALRAGVRDFVPKTQNFLNHLEPIVTRVLDQVASSGATGRIAGHRPGEPGAEARARARDRPAEASGACSPRSRGIPAADGGKREGCRHLHHRPQGTRRQLESGGRTPLRLRRARDPRSKRRRPLHSGRPGRRCPRAGDRRRRCQRGLDR